MWSGDFKRCESASSKGHHTFIVPNYGPCLCPLVACTGTLLVLLLSRRPSVVFPIPCHPARLIHPMQALPLSRGHPGQGC